MKTKYLWIISILFLTLTMSCNCSSPAPKNFDFTPVEPINFGRGVYYFPAIENEFGQSLTVFLLDSSKHVVAMTGDGTGAGGFDQGYWVVVKTR